MIGFGLKLPQGISTQGVFWDFLVRGASARTEVPAHRYHAEAFLKSEYAEQTRHQPGSVSQSISHIALRSSHSFLHMRLKPINRSIPSMDTLSRNLWTALTRHSFPSLLMRRSVWTLSNDGFWRHRIMRSKTVSYASIYYSESSICDANPFCMLIFSSQNSSRNTSESSPRLEDIRLRGIFHE